MNIAGRTVKPLWIALGAVALVILILIISIFTTMNSVKNQGVDKETALSAQYSDNQNELSSYISTFNETLGVADKYTQATDTVLVDAMKGRYDGHTSAQPGSGQLFSAIAEAYPSLASNAAMYAKVQDLVIAGRNAYKDKQSALLDMLRNYDKWRNSGIIHSMVVNMMGYPSSNLTAQTGTQILHGSDAEVQMKRLVLTSNAVTAYQNGTLDPLITPAPLKGATSAPASPASPAVSSTP